MRKLCNNGYEYLIDMEYVKEKMRRFSWQCGYVERRVIKVDGFNDYPVESYGMEGTLFFILEGSPPKAFAIYQKEHKRLIVISGDLDVVRKFNNVILVDEEE